MKCKSAEVQQHYKLVNFFCIDDCLFPLLGSTGVKAGHKHVDEIDPEHMVRVDRMSARPSYFLHILAQLSIVNFSF